MSTRTRSVAMLAANPAFAGILCRTLETDGHYRVASFAGVEALTTFLRISPVDVVILDCEIPGAPAADIARGLRQHLRLASSDFSVIALSRAEPAFHAPLIAAGIDLVLEKPVTPRQLLDAIEIVGGENRVARPTQRPAQRPASTRSTNHYPVQHSGNVVQLFAEGRAPR